MNPKGVTAFAGLEVRTLAAECLGKVLREMRTVEDVIVTSSRAATLDLRDRAFLFTLLLTTFRHLGEINAVLAQHLSKPLPRKSGLALSILQLGVTQLLFFDTPPHAAIDLAVRSAKADSNATHFSGLINAVLRKVAAGGIEVLRSIDSIRVNTPDWLWTRWVKSYGEAATRAFVTFHATEPAIDLSVKSDAPVWASRLGARLLPTGSLRLTDAHGPIGDLPGFVTGDWWVQDAAAAIPALLFGALQDKSALDLCAAPGGKTLQLCAAGAKVTVVDHSDERLNRLRENVLRCGFDVNVIVADVLQFEAGSEFDAILLDAPCSSTGTIRRHPELPYIKTQAQIGELRFLQKKMLKSASRWLRPGGTLVYCTCSLEWEEGEGQIERFLKENPDFSLRAPPSDWTAEEFFAAEGWVRILPHFQLGDARGLDGFFAAALTRQT